MPANIKNKITANVEKIAALMRKADAEAMDVRQEWKVAGVPGLSLVRTPNGIWSWNLRFMAGAGARRRSVRRAIGRANGPAAKTLAAARAEALKIATNGPQAFGDDAETKQTLRQLFDAFEKFDQADGNTKSRAPRTMKDYRYYLERDVFDALGDVPVNEITAKDIAKALTQSEARSPKAAHNCRAALGSLYKWAIKRMLVDDNPMIGMGFTHKGEPRDRMVTDGELARLWRAIDSEELSATPSMRIILKLAILTGQRNSEVAGARRSELHIGGAITNPHWQIPRPRMKRKTGKLDQYVFLSEQARKLFAEALELSGDSEFVFPAASTGRQVEGAEREHIGQESVSRAWARLRTLARVKDVHLHDTRKSITSWLGERGERSDVLDRIMDHAIGHHSSQRSSVTDSHYNFSIMARPLQDAWQRWADHVDAVSSVKAGQAANVVQLART